MAAASYTTDLTLIHACDASSASWTEPTGFAGGAITLPETDFYIQNTGCLSKNCGTTTPVGVGAIYNAGAGQTIPTDGAFLAWVFFGAPNTLDVEANGGIQLFIGSATTAFKQWYLLGSDTYPYGGWVNLAVDPTVTASATTGTPSATLQYFGAGVYVPGTAIASKGNPFGLDIIRYGRCESRINGGDLANGYATFTGFATQNDSNANRWGLIQAIDGGFLWKGLITLGYTSAVDFRDANTTVLIDNTKKVGANFNLIEVRQAGSRVDLTAISFLSLGTISKGRFAMIDNATVNITSCTFTDMDTFVFLSGATISNSTFRRCGQITSGGATISNSTIDKSTATTAILAGAPANAALISNSTFISDGTGYAIEITGTAADVTLTGLTFTGYAATNGTTGNEAIFVNIASGNMTISISGGGSTPSIRTAGATVTVQNSRTLSIAGLISGSRVAVLNTNGTSSNYDDDTEIAGTSNSGTTFTYDYNWTGTPIVANIVIIHNTKGIIRYDNQSLGANGLSLILQPQTDRQYENPV